MMKTIAKSADSYIEKMQEKFPEFFKHLLESVNEHIETFGGEDVCTVEQKIELLLAKAEECDKNEMVPYIILGLKDPEADTDEDDNYTDSDDVDDYEE